MLPLISKTKSLFNLTKGSLFGKNISTYISKKALDDIQKAHTGGGTMDKMKMYTKQAQLIFTQGFKGFKTDLNSFMQLRKRLSFQKSQPSEQDKCLQMKLYDQMQRMKTVIIIQILPFSGPIFLYYIYTHPNKLPSWFCVDQYVEQYHRNCRQKQAETIQYYIKNPLKKQGFSVATTSFQDIKRLSDLCFGHYNDGLIGINKMSKSGKKEYLIHPHFSKHLVIRNMKKQFKRQMQTHQQLKNMQFDQMLLWKYDRIMNHGDRIVVPNIVERQEEIKRLQTQAKTLSGGGQQQNK